VLISGVLPSRHRLSEILPGASPHQQNGPHTYPTEDQQDARVPLPITSPTKPPKTPFRNPFVCTDHDPIKTFHRAKDYQRHMNTVHGEKVFRCPANKCRYSTARRDNFNRHRLTKGHGGGEATPGDGEATIRS
jgi:uncharacterized C2H2 Zn-finger protein